MTGNIPLHDTDSSYFMFWTSLGTPSLRLARPRGPTVRLRALFPPFYLKTEIEYSFRNVGVVVFCNVEDDESPNEQFYTSS